MCRTMSDQWRPTSQSTGLEAFTVNALLQDTTGYPKRSCIHALMGQSQVRLMVISSWIGPGRTRPADA